MAPNSQHFVAVSTVRGALSAVFREPKGDFCERLASQVTVGLLSLIAAVLLTSHYWGEPIQCWVPAQYTQWWVSFVNNYCYVHGTYYVPLTRPLSWDIQERQQIQIQYYQWVPYVLAVQAFLFYLPHVLWKQLCGVSGVDVSCVIRNVQTVWKDVQDMDGDFETRTKRFETQSVPLFWDALRLQRRRGWNSPALFACFLLVKVAHTANAITQWLWLNESLKSTRYPYWGFSILMDLYRGNDWQVTGHFPRVTHCDFSQRKASSFNLESVLCVLTLNVYYEKIFLFLWFWLLMVSIVCFSSTVYWAYIFMLPKTNVDMVTKYLTATESADVLYSDISHQGNECSAQQVYPQEAQSSNTPTSLFDRRKYNMIDIPHDERNGYLEPTEIDPLRPPTYRTSNVNPNVTQHIAPRTLVSQKFTKAESRLFTDKYLRADGMFLIRQMAINLGDLPAAYMTRALYNSVLDSNRHPLYHLQSDLQDPQTGKLYAALLKGAKIV